MKNMGLHEVRKKYLDFFKDKEHKIIDSFPLVPLTDKSLLLINAGMAPLKPYFTGEKKAPAKRIANCQRCIRTGDIENVGMTARHATYFEMLGNFSFGDYFKEEAIEWSWEFLHEVLEIPEEDLWVSIYYEDDEAKSIWEKKIGVDPKKIVPLGKEDNFWELEVGPCGPSSEIYVDRGEEVGCGLDGCKPGCECDRFLEVWNLVFTQFDKDEFGEYKPIDHPNIDTGMGLERIAAVLQDTDNIFEVKEIKELLDYVVELTGQEYGISKEKDISIRIITDHVRAMTFLVSDGVLPSNEGRGYVLRRLIRRAARHGKLLGLEEAFLIKIVDKFIDSWKVQYGELDDRRDKIKKVIYAEEMKFQETIDQGLEILSDLIRHMIDSSQTILDGENAFKLYDTYGFPLDLTKEILEEKNLSVDEEGFNKNMEEQRIRARKARTTEGDMGWKNSEELGLDIETEFDGYTNIETSSKVLAIIKNGEEVEGLEAEEEGIIVLDKTPFYAESGGQVGDSGLIYSDKFKAEVLDTQKEKDTFLHAVVIVEGKINLGDLVTTKIDRNRRSDIMKNHSATHLLHKALKDVLGEHVNQAGSLVLPDRLRFDFTHYQGLTDNEIDKIEESVNNYIFDSLDVKVEEMSLEESKEKGVVGLFDNKYDDMVRVVNMGDESIELCGGTHVSNTSEIGMFKILSESGIASGVRRIEAITGREVYNLINEFENRIDMIAKAIKVRDVEIVGRVKEMSEELKEKDREIQSLSSKMTSSLSDGVLDSKKEVNGINYITYKNDELDMDGLRQLGDQIKDKLTSYVIVLASGREDKAQFVSMVSKDLNDKGIHAGKMIKDVASITGGGGGGRPDMAQAGGKDISKIEAALDSVRDIIKDQVK